MRKIIFIVLVYSLGFNSLGFADSYSPSHSCSKPSKPYEFEDEYELESFKSNVEQYKQCIEDFIEEQNDEAQEHLNAAEEAASEWNSYASYELN
ncbi:MAG: hypothetical protein Q9M50_00550 [Methylococcales bacterium]|nr:hypothetical protein [Methylococcales bacterium]